MRWDALFVDLDAQAEALEWAERAGEVAERARLEAGAVSLGDRLRPAVGRSVRMRCTGALALGGQLRRVGPDWLLLEDDAGRETVVALSHVLATEAGPVRVADRGADDVVASRLGLRFALRGIVQDRAPVLIHLIDGSHLRGTLDQVGVDFVEVAVHPADVWRRPAEVRAVQLLAIGALVAVRREE